MAAVKVLEFDKIDREVMERWDITGHQVNRHLLSRVLTGTPDVVADLITFPPGFVHRMHRHPHADQFMVLLEGSVQFRGDPEPPVTITTGQLLLIPRGNWHEVSNPGPQDAQALHFFTGVGSIEDIGYEAYPGLDDQG